ncbi:MAG: hypothetical protein K8F30_00415 [Taibaiella sp.]|nr:hypothetical protein [Taibaiella sp.]
MKHMIIAMVALLMLPGCLTERKALKRIMKMQAAHPAAVATACAGLYPPLEYTRDSMVYKPGARSEIVYVYADCDSAATKGQGMVKIPCPPLRITDTLVLYKEKQVVNRASIEALRAEMATCNNVRARLARDRQILFWVMSAIILYILIKGLIKRWRIFV